MLGNSNSHFEQMIAWRFAGLTRAAVIVTAADRRANVTLSLADAAGIAGRITKMRQVDLGHGNAHQIFAFFADQLAARYVFAQLFFDLAANDLPETAVVLFYFFDHIQNSIRTPEDENSSSTGDGDASHPRARRCWPRN
jgi:hypothetical protein